MSISTQQRKGSMAKEKKVISIPELGFLGETDPYSLEYVLLRLIRRLERRIEKLEKKKGIA